MGSIPTSDSTTTPGYPPPIQPFSPNNASPVGKRSYYNSQSFASVQKPLAKDQQRIDRLSMIGKSIIVGYDEIMKWFIPAPSGEEEPTAQLEALDFSAMATKPTIAGRGSMGPRSLWARDWSKPSSATRPVRASGPLAASWSSARPRLPALPCHVHSRLLSNVLYAYERPAYGRRGGVRDQCPASESYGYDCGLEELVRWHLGAE